MLYRSTKLYGTKFVIGVVLYAGRETKAFYRLKAQRKKKSSFYNSLQILLGILIGMYTALVIFCVLKYYSNNPYDQIPQPQVVLSLILEFTNITPITMFFYLAITKVFQSSFIRYQMRNQISWKTISCNESLGQIEYILSSTTGTITENKLQIQACLIGSSLYVDKDSQNVLMTQIDDYLNDSCTEPDLNFSDLRKRLRSDEVKEFFICSLLCCYVEIDKRKESQRLGLSKVEVILNEYCKSFQVSIVSQTHQCLMIDYTGDFMQYNVILNINGRNSRVLVENSNHKWVLYVRGPERKILKILDMEAESKRKLVAKIDWMKSKGYMIHVLAYKEFKGPELLDIKNKVNEASSFSTKIPSRIEKIFRKFEKNLSYIGVYGIDDAIIPDTHLAISQLQDSGVKIWVASSESKTPTLAACRRSGIITKDHTLVSLSNIKTYNACVKCLNRAILEEITKEDPTNISQIMTLLEYKNSSIDHSSQSYSSELLSLSAQDYNILHEENQPRLEAKLLEKNATKVLKRPYDSKNIKISVLMDRISFRTALSHPCTTKLLTCLLFAADSVCLYKFMGEDKSDAVHLLKNNLVFRPHVLAIGNGTGDTPMLQAADVGITVHQPWNTNKSYYSDILLEHFSLIRDLLLLHGYWNANRTGRVLLLFIYKNIMLVTATFLYLPVSNYSVGSNIDASLSLWYNVLLTSFTIVVLGTEDEKHSKRELIFNSLLYSSGILNKEISTVSVISYLLTAVLNGIVIFEFIYWLMSSYLINSKGYTENYEIFGTVMLIELVVTSLLEILLKTYKITSFFIGTNIFSVTILVFLVSLMGVKSQSSLLGVNYEILSSPVVLLVVCTVPLICFVLNTLIAIFFDTFASKNKINRVKNYEKSLNSVYRDSNLSKKASTELYSLNKYTLRFISPYIEKQYQQSYITTNIKAFRRTISILCGIIIIMTVIESVLYSINTDYFIPKIVMVAIFIGFTVISCTVDVYKYYVKLSFFLMLYVIGFKVFFEIAYNYSSFSGTALIPSINFIFFNIDWIKINSLNVVNLAVFILVLFTKNSSNYEVYCLIQSVFALISIIVTSTLLARVLEKTRRQEYKLTRLQEVNYEKTQRILGFLLPSFVQKRVKDGVRYIAEDQGTVTVLFCDIVDFDIICAEYSPVELTTFLDDFFQKLDVLCDAKGVSKIETVGKTYMACAGLKDSEIEMEVQVKTLPHAKRCINLAFSILEETYKCVLKKDRKLEVKIGIHSGPVTAGVVGHHKPQFSLVGDTVNTASRMCSTLALGNTIQISKETYKMVPDIYNIPFQSNNIFAKGKGILKTYTYSSKNPIDYGKFLEEFGSLRTSTILTSGANTERTESKSVTKERGFMGFMDESFRTENIFLEQSNWLKCNFNESDNQRVFRLNKLENNKQFVHTGIKISLFNYFIVLISCLTKFLLGPNRYIELLSLRGSTIFVLVILSIVYKSVFKRRLFPIYYVIILLVILSTNLIEKWVDASMSSFDSLEVVYIILMLNHMTGLSIKGITWFYPLIVAPWLSISLLVDRTHGAILDILLTIAFGAINSLAVYSRESQLRNYFNLKAFTEKDLMKTENLLVQMMPPHVLENMKNNRSITDKMHEVTLLYADIVGFTKWSSDKSPNTVVDMLSQMFTRFDKLCVVHNVYKVHTIGDCYVVMSCIDSKNRDPRLECNNVLKMALSMTSVIENINSEQRTSLNMRIGIHTGTIIAGVIGTNIVRYDIYGPDVLIANKMESCGKSGKIHVSDVTKNVIENSSLGNYEFVYNKDIVIKTIDRKHSGYFLSIKSNLS
jgi:magnesium-transporting ATPase (P-type)/class 3 adenylate cyclase